MTWNPKPETLRIVAHAREVVAAAEAQGLKFTLRRVFYKLVSANVIPNTERAYKNLSRTLDRARWEGLLPLDALDDLGRQTVEREQWDSPEEMLRARADTYRSDWWADEDVRCEVWAEKQAVTSILAPVALAWGTPFLACRGFASLTAVAESAERCDRPTTVFYVGDHDPSGLDMDRDLQERLWRLGADVNLVRLALTPEQIDDYGLPPQPTKHTDSRARGYSREHGGSWELDALPEDALQALVREAIEAIAPFDRADRLAADEETRQELRRHAETYDA